ncbi:MAG: SAM-dependent methyltransferase [Dehalococcoidia bacterium]
MSQLAFDTPITKVIKKLIESNKGKINFANFMSTCMTNENFGYYSSKHLSWDQKGDYQTSPEVHPVFGYLWAKQINECWGKMNKPKKIQIIEIGAGSAIFMANICTWIKSQNNELYDAAEIILLDVSQKRLDQQKKILDTYEINASFSTLSEFLNKKTKSDAIVISNEFFDCLPFHLIKKHKKNIYEIFVSLSDNNELIFKEEILSDKKIIDFINNMEITLFEGCIVEITPQAYEASQKIAELLNSGYIITIDYGDLAENLLQEWNKEGTFKAITNHMLTHPLDDPGNVDITADVNFTILKKGLEEKQFKVNALTSQWQSLINLGIFELIKKEDKIDFNNSARYFKTNQALSKLLEPEQLGKMKVQIAGKNVPTNNLLYMKG